MPRTVPCPSCGVVLPPAASRCPFCRLSLVGAALQQRRMVLLTDLQSAPVPAVGVPLVTLQDAPSAGPQPRQGLPAQQVLLAVGALLVLVAASVFLAVAWDVIGVGGLVAAMALVTLVAGGSSVAVAQRGLRASAEALAVLAAALALVDAAAAHWLDLAGLSAVDLWGYAAWVTAA